MGRAHRTAVAGTISGLVLAVLLPATRAEADITRLPGTLTTTAQRTGPLSVSVPAGVVPSALNAVVAADRVVDGATVALLVNGREALRIPSALFRRVAVPISPADVVADGTLALTLRYDGPPGSTGCETPPAITVRRLALDYTGVETPPATVADFFPDGASRVDVRLPPEPDDELIEAGLNAVAGLSVRYGRDTPVELSTTDRALPSVGAGQRVVQIVSSTAAVTTGLGSDSGVPALVLSGNGRALSEAAAVVAAPDPAPDDPSPTRTEARPGVARTVTLDDLGRDAGPPPASAASTVEVALRQDSFGGPVSSLRIHLEGTHSAVPAGVTARLDVHVGDTLVQSVALGPEPGIDLDVEVPGDLVRSATTLRAAISSATTLDPAAPVDPAVPVAPVQCSPGLPLELALDPIASRVASTPGLGDVRGFQLFPQVLHGRLPVAIRQEGPARVDGAVDAARLVSAVQRQAATRLDVTLIEPAELLADDRSGLLVGADEADSVALGAPVTLAGTRTADPAQTAFDAASPTPFVALQALAGRGRFVLLLGSWAPADLATSEATSDGTAARPRLPHRVTRNVVDDGWAALEGDVLLLDTGSPPYLVDSGTPIDPATADAALAEGEETPEISGTAATAESPDPEPASTGRVTAGSTEPYLGWIALGVVLPVLLALLLGRMLRRRREAVERAEAAEAGPTGAGRFSGARRP